MLSRSNPLRLDAFLKNQIGHMSRHQLKKVIDLKGVLVNGKIPKASKRLKAGDVVEVRLPPRPAKFTKPQDIPLAIVYEDDHFVVVNKQANLTVHPAKAQVDGTLVNALAFHFLRQRDPNITEAQAQQYAVDAFNARAEQDLQDGKGGRVADAPDTPDPNASEPKTPEPIAVVDDDPDEVEIDEVLVDEENPVEGPLDDDDDTPADYRVIGLSEVGAKEARPGIVHRLDKNTTGLIIIAKRNETHWLLARQFEQRTNLKCYLALVHGCPEIPGGVINEPIARHPTIREAQCVRHDSLAKDSVTLYRVRERYRGYSLVELELKTGRTHQIRVHLSWLGHPLVGDILYGGEPIYQSDITPEADPLEPAGGRPHYSYGRNKPDGNRIAAAAAAREDLILATPALHAAILRIQHPAKNNEPMTFSAPISEPLLSLITAMRQRPDSGPVVTDGVYVDLPAEF